MSTSALLLRGELAPSVAEALGKMLALFGVESSVVSCDDVASVPAQGQARLLCAASDFLQLLDTLDTSAALATAWQRSVHSAFVCAPGNPATMEAVARRVTGDVSASARAMPAGHAWQVSAQLPGMCGAMSGLRITPTRTPQNGLGFDRATATSESIVGDGECDAFLKTEYLGVPVFLSMHDVIDVDEPLPGRAFDVRDRFLEAVPVVLYVRWAFAEICWRPAVTPACLVVDDPPLWPRYGHLHFGRLLELMETLDFCTSIAFIPWNWRRGRRDTVDLFARNPARLSLSIHGCDHTGGEYGSTDRDALLWRTRQAVERMTQHASRTGLPFDKVMVFPQGVFSEAGVEALKRTGFLAAVNTEVTSVDSEAGRIRIRDYWDVAVMRYASFPVFTRRHPSDGIENFAFDILLGKPCLVVLHHGDFHGDARQVAVFVQQLSELNARLRWMTLADVARHSTRQRHVSPDEVEVEIYGARAHVETPTQDCRTRVCRREVTPGDIEEILVRDEPVAWTEDAGRVWFRMDGTGGNGAEVAVRYRQPPMSRRRQSVRSKAMVAARRYLCDSRDHYLMPKTSW